MHNAFRGGCSAAFPEVEEAASAAYWIFKDSPARREDFASLNPDVKFPLKFCRHRWVENENVLLRLLEILPDIKNYIKEIEIKKLPQPNNKSFGILQDTIKDELFSAKCSFVLSVVKDIEPFLKLYQTDKPMLPFLNGDLFILLKDLMQRFVKEESLPKSSIKLLNVTLDDKAIFKDSTKINIGFVAKKKLKCLSKEVISSEKKTMDFYLNCRLFLLTLTKKLLKKCPLNFSLVRNMACLDPRVLVINKEGNLSKLQSILLYLTNAGRVKEDDCDTILKEYSSFVADFSSMDTETKFRHCCNDSFDPLVDRLDSFYYEFLSNSNYSNLWNVVQVLLLLSHGQASVERGFSINKNLLVENLANQTIVAKRIIDDHLRFVGGLEKVIISKELIISAAGAREKYLSYLEEQKICKKNTTSGEKRKLLTESLEDLERKKKRLEVDVEELNKTADDYSEKAERNSNLSLISKANALRRHAKEKVNEIKKCEEDLNDMYTALKNIQNK